MQTVTELIELNGPELASMPARMTHFSNTVGLTLTCVGRGPPPLTISWLSGTGEELSQIPGIREELQNGSLYFPPFKPEDYIPTVHNGEYRCSVRNPVGTFLSPVLSVRAIVDHPFEVMILLSSDSNDLIIEGSPALLSCDVTPSFYSQFVRIIAWKSIDQFGHATEILENDSRYKIIKDGSLLIFNTKHQQLFVCIGQSSLNRKSQVSAPFLLKAQGGGRIVPNPKRVNLRHPNSLVGQENVIRGEMGKTTDITCLAVGSPSPTFRWEKYHKGKFVPVTSVLGSSAKTQGPLLRLTQTNPFHNGTYRCEVSNSLGTFSVDYTFLLESNPSLVIEPRRKVARNGESIELSCNLQANSSLGIGLYNNSNVDFMWFKDGKSLNRKIGQKKSPFNRKLQIFNSKLEDQGVYQCFAEVLGAEGVSQSVHASSSIMFECS
ncbi:Down syndrome cell adhesion molecule-like protein Dscam2 [Orchesella cincta]|uniref:Down syndrome cell adhesion molecule-like protein Dscam2 n=1 Tax=Orchesella cincta TaxID=48709 RepID=A0A1D2MGW3_ORCCI|nr:Down syndrome cell adhesion molecule-like protein Dscam2 [Orchesella cincta]